MDELPNNIRTDIYKDFLFADFLYMFQIHFKMQREENIAAGNQNDGSANFYEWPDTQYSAFMISILQSLEPRFFEPKEFIFEEEDEVNE